MDKAHVAVLMGGVSSEHEVSMKSGANAVAALGQKGYRVTPVAIEKDGGWRFEGGTAVNLGEAVARLLKDGVECVFIALHGPFGEDGRMQGLFDLVGLPYTGSGHTASAIAMDKVRSKALVEQAGVRVARQVLLKPGDAGECAARIGAEIGFPCVLKSPCQGSSLGMAIPKSEAECITALPTLFELDTCVMAEEFLQGPEVTCGVLDAEKSGPRAMPVTEIRPVTSAFFDYHAKYTPGACREITPAEISPEATRRVQEMALRAHEVIGCRGFSRSDMILVGDEPVWLEVNTIPGLTETSLFPQAAANVGISLSDLLGMLVEAALIKD
jgi:D-alanine-D-alanine ligase